MTRLRGSWTAAAAVTLFLLGACARADAIGAPSESGSPGASESGVPAPADQLVLRVAQTGGFIGMNTLLTRLPAVSVYADGRVITQGPQIAIYPGPALPNIQVQLASPATVDGLVEKGRQLGAVGDLGQPNIADATTTEITVGGRTIAAYALNEAQSNDPSLTAAQRAARAKVAAFVDLLTGLPAAQGMPAAQPYQPTAVAVLAQPWVKPADDQTSAPAATPWPGPALPGEYVRPGVKLGCLAVTGDQAGKVLAAAQDANQITPWTSGSATWSVTFRPLLPDETGCADLQGKR
jgi:hypothetical protein